VGEARIFNGELLIAERQLATDNWHNWKLAQLETGTTGNWQQAIKNSPCGVGTWLDRPCIEQHGTDQYGTDQAFHPALP